MSTATEPSFPSNKRDWTFVWRALVFIVSTFGTVCAAGLLFSAKAYVRAEAGEEVQQAMAPLATLPSRVEKLEDFKVEAKASIKANADIIMAIREVLAAQQAMQNEQNATNKRILDSLDRLNRRNGTEDTRR